MDVTVNPFMVGVPPADGHFAEPTLDRRRTFPIQGGQLADCLLVGLVKRPYFFACQHLARTELVFAGLAVVRLFPILFAVPFRYP